jgi:iron(III) transport system permease protein
MLGLALIFVYLTFKVGIYGSIWIIVIAYVTTYVSYSTRLINSTMFQIHKELEEAAQVSGASIVRIFRTIIIPLLAPSIIGLWVWVLVHAMRELSAALVLQSHKSFVLTTLMWNFWDRGNVPQLATIAVGMVATLFFIMAVGQLISGRYAIPTGIR